MRRSFYVLSLVAVFAFLAARPAAAMLVQMTTLELDPANHVRDVEVVNNESSAKVVQVDTERWAMSENGDVAAQPSNDLIVSPRVFTIAPGTRQIVRITWRAMPVDGEGTYRVRIRELGDAGQSMISAALHTDYIVFVFATNPIFTKPSVALSAARLDAGHVRFTFDNAGEKHARLGRVVVTEAPNAQADYSGTPFTLLFGKSRRGFVVALPQSASSSQLSVQYEVNGRLQRTKLDVQ